MPTEVQLHGQEVLDMRAEAPNAAAQFVRDVAREYESNRNNDHGGSKAASSRVSSSDNTPGGNTPVRSGPKRSSLICTGPAQSKEQTLEDDETESCEGDSLPPNNLPNGVLFSSLDLTDGFFGLTEGFCLLTDFVV